MLLAAAAGPDAALAQDAAPDPPDTVPPTFTLVGDVVDALVGTPVVAAVIKAPSLRRLVYSDVNGRFRLPEVPEGELEIVVEMLGYRTIDGTVSVAEGNGLFLRMRPDPIALEGLAVRTRAEGLFDRRRRFYPYRVTTISPRTIAEAINNDPVAIFKRSASSLVVSCTDRNKEWIDAGCYYRRGEMLPIRLVLDEMVLPGGMRTLTAFAAMDIHSMDWLRDTGTLHVYTKHYVAQLNSTKLGLAPFKWPMGW